MLACALDFDGWYCLVDGKSYVRCVGATESACEVESIGLGIRFEIEDMTRLERLARMDEMDDYEFLREYCCDGMVGDRCILSLIGFEDFSQYLDTSNDLRGTLTFSQEDRLHYFYRVWEYMLNAGDDSVMDAIEHLLAVSERFNVMVR